jgi:hypothetical protein
MIQPLARVILLLTFLFTACIGFIHARPFDSPLRAVFADGCPMPCFMGIRPGVTTVDEAVALLSAHEWVGEIEISIGLNQLPNTVLWTWSGRQPGFIQDTIYGNPYRGNLRIRNRMVTAIWIPTTVALGELWLLGGNPDVFAAMRFRRFNEQFHPLLLSFYHTFSGNQFASQTFADCPYVPVDWYAPVAITMGDVTEVAFVAEGDTMPYDHFTELMVINKQTYC